MEMVQIIKKLKQPERFWPWLRGIAFNKLRHYFRDQKKHKLVSLSDMEYHPEDHQNQDGLAVAIGEELKQVVLKAMTSLKPNHRMILNMRCYEGLEYPEIAEMMGCSEFAARMQFFRAKNSLAKQLSKAGYVGTTLLALSLFGKMTATSQAAVTAVSVTKASLEVGTLVSVVGSLTTTTAVVTTVAAAGVLTVGTAVMQPNSQRADVMPADSFVAKAWQEALASINSIDSSQHWYYFPQGANGPMMTRCFDKNSSDNSCLWLQNHTGNFYFDGALGKVCLMNRRMYHSDLRVTQLPTDEPWFTSELNRLQGFAESMNHIDVDSNSKALLMTTTHASAQSPAEWTLIKNVNALREDYFKPDWPVGTQVVDERDAMHRQGYCGFTVSGHIGQMDVSGRGRMPFVYAMTGKVKPVLRMTIGQRFEVMDSAAGAVVQDKDSNQTQVYSSGSFFAGLSRPWLGLHTIDTVRRDAVKQKMKFTTELNAAKTVGTVTVFDANTEIVYTIDMENDLLTAVRFNVGGQSGQLNFEYRQLMDLIDDVDSGRTSATDYPNGVLWLVDFLSR